MAAERAEQAVAQAVASAAAGATAAPSPSARQQGVASRKKRPGDEAFFKGSVECMASEPRMEFPLELEAAVVETASALLAPVY